MLAGALEFTLGLQANQFLGTLGITSSNLLSFLGLAGSIQGAFHKMWEAVEKGGALQDLAVRTNTSVASLYSLQRAFEQIGASADTASPLILRLQRQLSSEGGGGILRSMGLDPDQLKGKETVEQISMIADAIAQLNPSQQSKAAFGLFGREGSATILQIARSGHEFRDAIAATRADADIWQKTAARFDSLGDKVKEIQGHIETMFAAAAGALIAAFDQGGLGGVATLLTDTIVAGLQGALIVAPAIFQQLGMIILRTLSPYLTPVQHWMERAAFAAIDILGSEKAGGQFSAKALELEERRAAMNKKLAAAGRPLIGKSSDVFAESLSGIESDPLMLGNVSIEEMSRSANEKTKAALDKASAIFQEGVGSKVGALLGGLPQSTAGSAAAAGTEEILGGAKRTRSDVTNLERMGAIFGGLGRGFGQDHARATADNTRRTADTVKAIYDKMTTGESASFANT